jgi:hypothetical protein
MCIAHDGIVMTALVAGERRIIWKSAGLHLVGKSKSGWLSVTGDLLRAYFTRPEVHPVDESCDQEHRLFEKLMSDPFVAVRDDELADIVDADAADNYRIVLSFRDHLARHGTVEQAYAGLFGDEPINMPPVFIDQLAHLILAGMLEQDRDPFHAKAAELFFREQKATTEGGQLIFADAEVVEMRSQTGGMGGLGNLLLEAGTPLREVSLDILTEENAGSYWARADMFDFALDFRFTQPGLDAFARVIERWVRHFHHVDVRVQAVQSIRDDRWSWHVGLDAESTRVLNALYNGEMDDPVAASQIAGLFRLEFLDRTDVIDTIRGKPVYLGLSVKPDGTVRTKPQNLLTNLPLRKLQ